MAKKLPQLPQVAEQVKEIYCQIKNGKIITKTTVYKHPHFLWGFVSMNTGKVELSIGESVKPKVVPQCRIPSPNRKQFHAVLQELEDEDIIEPIEVTTEWI